MQPTPEPRQLLGDLQAAGLRLRVVGDRLVIRPRSALTDMHRDLIRAHKPSLLALVGDATPTKDTTPEQPPALTAEEQDDIREWIEERAAIQEFDGGLPRPNAERAAHQRMRVYRVKVQMPPPATAAQWVTVLAPGCDQAAAEHAARYQFGAERVLAVVEHRGGAS